MSAPSGLVIVDKPAGLTSHDVVTRIRALAGTRRVGHAGTLDPMATGVLVVGVEQATRLLGHLALTQKEYEATIRLGQVTDTDDADGEVISCAPAGRVTADAVRAAVTALTGEIQQVPPAVSAVKVAGRRAYRLARAGLRPALEPRAVTVHEFTVLALRSDGGLTDADVRVTCSTGTYIRALARDLGTALGTGGHLSRLRRTRVGPYRAADARSLSELAGELTVLPLDQAAAAAFPRLHLSAEQAGRLAHGARLAVPAAADGTLAAFGPDGSLIALVRAESGQCRPLAVFAAGLRPGQ